MRILYNRCTSIKLNNCVLGSASSRHYKSSLIMIHSPALELSHCLCEIQYFAAVTVCLGDEHTSKVMWLAVVQRFMIHELRNWFGWPAQVWSLTRHSTYSYVPVFSIESRVVSSKVSVKFDTACSETIVVVPIEYK